MIRFMKNEAIYFTKKAVLSYLQDHGRPQTKDYEFAAALALHYRCEKESKGECYIGFHIRRDHRKSLPGAGSEKVLRFAEIVRLLQSGIDEDTPIDFVIANRVNMREVQGMMFQAKRFGIGRRRRDTDELIAYLKGLRYGKSRTKLLICLDDWVSVDLDKLYADIDFASLSFGGVLFLWLSDGFVHIKDIYPQGNVLRYPITDLYEPIQT